MELEAGESLATVWPELPADILGSRDQLEVSRSDTHSPSAEVVQLLSIGDRSVRSFPGHQVGLARPALLVPVRGVAIAVDRALP